MKTLTLTLMLLGSTLVYAQSLPTSKSATVESSGNDKLDIKKLEQKYWSAKDDDFAVVQNRRYTKANRLFLSGNYGVPFNDPFSSGNITGLNFGYFFNERWGVDLDYKTASLHDNDATSQFINQYGTYPDHNVFKSSQIISGTLVPFYAKMSFMDNTIIYFDMGLSIGLGTMKYAIQKVEGNEEVSSAVGKLSVFQQIFFSEHFALRADLSNTWSSQKRLKYYLPNSGGNHNYTTERDLGSKMTNDTSMLLGVTYWF